MQRLALLAFVGVLGILALMLLLPERERAVPDATITLHDTELTLYPREDPQAVWTFRSEKVAYDPTSRSTTLRNIRDSRRKVDGVTDFTLESEEITIDNRENIRSERMVAHLVDADWYLDMQAGLGREVLINQSRGRFEVPILEYWGEGLFEKSRSVNVTTNFDLTDYESQCDGYECKTQFLDDSGEEP